MKKLDLSPLPEQTEDYSHYQETVVRWDRIVSVGLGLCLVLGLIINFVVSPSSDLKESKHDAAQLSETNVISSTNESISELQTDSQTPGSIVKPSDTMVVSDSAMAEKGKILEDGLVPGLNIVSSIDTEAVIKKIPTPQQEISISSEGEQQQSGNQKTNIESAELKATSELALDLAPTIIVNSAIEHAVLSLSIDDKLPGAPLSKEIAMKDQGLIKVILYTVMKDIKGKTLYHEWYRNDVRQARVKIPVNVTVQKSYSSKFINKQMLGHWKVKVVDKDGEPYVLADFEVVN